MYQGTWAADLPHGLGQCRFADGSVYRGPFVRGRMHGRGVLLNFDATVAFDGEWRDGERYHQAYPSLPRPLHPWRNGQRRFRSSLSLTRPHRALTGALLGHIHVSAVGTERPHSTRRSRTTRSQCVVCVIRFGAAAGLAVCRFCSRSGPTGLPARAAGLRPPRICPAAILCT